MPRSAALASHRRTETEVSAELLEVKISMICRDSISVTTPASTANVKKEDKDNLNASLRVTSDAADADDDDDADDADDDDIIIFTSVEFRAPRCSEDISGTTIIADADKLDVPDTSSSIFVFVGASPMRRSLSPIASSITKGEDVTAAVTRPLVTARTIASNARNALRLVSIIANRSPRPICASVTDERQDGVSTP